MHICLHAFDTNEHSILIELHFSYILQMKRGFKLRRFKSEVSVREEKGGVINGKPSTTTALSIEPSGGGESDATELLQMEGLSHAVSQPNILHIKQPSLHHKHKRPTGKALHPISAASVYTYVFCTLSYF
jgi:hypothetical protein